MKYILMNKNTPAFDFESEDDTVYAISMGTVFNKKYAPLAIEIDDGFINRKNFNDWLSGRRIPASREQLAQVLEGLSRASNQNVTTALLAEKCFYLSLYDQYWIKPSDSEIVWKDINFFQNPFSDDIGSALFDENFVNDPDLFSPCNSSDGVLKKKWQIRNGKRCFIKSGTGTLSQETFNEEIASELCRLLKISNYVPYKVEMFGQKPVSICECFIDETTELITANDVISHFLPNRRISPYEHYIKCCEGLGCDVRPALDEMMIVDFIIGNTDRHYRNFGLIRNVETLGVIGAAPIFDCGTALYHNVPDKLIDPYADIRSKPFAEYHSQQIKLVSEPQRFDLSPLELLPSRAADILSRYDFLQPERIECICNVLKARTELLTRELSIR